MFHAARAAVLARGYTEKSHYCLLVAFREFYAVDDGSRRLARGIERARALRESADYLGEFSVGAAEAVLVVAREFVGFVESHVTAGGA